VLAGGLVIILLAVGVWMSIPSFVGERGPEGTQLPVMPVASKTAVEDYFTSSRMLLIGIANMSPEQGKPIDLSVERSAARSLVRQARLLSTEPVDERSQELIRDLERILIELANLEETADVPGIELIRTGVREQNLLFKIRMAENQMSQE
jgi:hypothetical protein